MPSLESDTRRRKAHTKSRQGCGNCKLRRVKCDETKPKCQKCISFGVSCDYESKDPDLQFDGLGAFQIDIPQPETPNPLEKLIDGMMNAPLHLHVDPDTDGPDICYIDQPHLDLLRKFHRRTVLTLGTEQTRHVYRDELVKLALKHSFVLHAILRITLMHDRYIYDPIGTKPSAAEVFHSYHGVAIFSAKLKAPLLEEEKDAMWGAAAMIGACAFASIEATCFADAWPLKEPSIQDLDWLKMSEGKKEVWKMANPLREGSIWRAALLEEQNKTQAHPNRPTHPDLDRLAPFVMKVYHLDSPPPHDGNDPYYTAASIIQRLVPIECTQYTVMWFLSFMGHMEPEFRQLLEAKDPQALVLLAWWHAKLIPYSSWWMSRRSLFECQALCVYLDKILPRDSELRPLTEFPRIASGLQPPTPVQLPSPGTTSEGAWEWQQKF